MLDWPRNEAENFGGLRIFSNCNSSNTASNLEHSSRLSYAQEDELHIGGSGQVHCTNVSFHFDGFSRTLILTENQNMKKLP